MSVAVKVMTFLAKLGAVGVDIAGKVEAAQAASSAGGKTLTFDEIVEIVEAEIDPVVKAIAGLFT